MSGDMVRQDIRQKLHAFHNSVNDRVGKSRHPLSPIGVLDRSALYTRVREDFDFLKTNWPFIHAEWKQSTSLLISLVQGGPLK